MPVPSLKALLKLALISCLCWPITPVNAVEVKEIQVVSAHWPEYTNEDGTGAYWEIVKAIYEPAGIQVSTRTMPWVRAEWSVINKQSDALLGTYLLKGEYAKGLKFPKWHISVEEPIVAVFKKGAINNWKNGGIKLLKNLKVAWIRGYEFDLNLLKGINIHKHVITYPEQALTMVDLGRMDVFLDYESNIRKSAQKAKIDLEGNLELKLAKSGNKLFVAFADTHKTKALIKIYDQRMKELVASGAIKKIYKKWGFSSSKF